MLVEIIASVLKQTFPRSRLAFGCQPVFYACFLLFVAFSFLFSPFVKEKDGKTCFNTKRMISTSKGWSKYPFASQNTQHSSIMIVLTITVIVFDSYILFFFPFSLAPITLQNWITSECMKYQFSCLKQHYTQNAKQYDIFRYISFRLSDMSIKGFILGKFYFFRQCKIYF